MVLVRQPLISHAPAFYLISVPIFVISVSVVCFSKILPAVIESSSNPCSPVTQPLPRTACVLSAFFRECLATTTSRAFIASFLAFVSALLTITHVEASRRINQPSTILTRPTLTWLAVNIVTGSVVSPVVLCANIKRHKDGIRLRPKDPRPEIDTALQSESSSEEVRPLISNHDTDSSSTAPPVIHDRHLLSLQHTYAIPISVLFGFVLPSILLFEHPSPLVATLWNFFPVAIYAAHALALRLLRDDRQSSFYAERDARSVVRIYAIPVTLSILAHIYLVTSWLYAKEEAQDEWGPAPKLMLINFWTIVATYLYWLLIESSFSTMTWAVLIACFGGPGAGISVGWVLKDLRHASLAE